MGKPQNVVNLPTRKPDSAYNTKQWAQLHKDLFDTVEVNGNPYEPGKALARVKEFADHNTLAPVAVLALAIMRVCASVPVGTTFNAGIGPGSLNQLNAIVGRPGSGKDRHSYRVARALSVYRGNHKVEPQELPLTATGEGVVEALKHGPAILGTSEVGGLHELMKRQGSTLRATMLSAYSGNAIGFTNKKDPTSIAANGYVLGMWVSIQPDKAGALLEGEDDGLAHRFLWFEPINPTLIDDPITPDEDNQVTELHPVYIPEGIEETGVKFHESIVQETVLAGRETLTYGPRGNNNGHRHQTRLKVAAGLALLASRKEVDLGDWHRAGALMDYSDAVRRNCQRHLENKEVDAVVKRSLRHEAAADQIHKERYEKAERLIRGTLTEHESVKRSDLRDKARRFRQQFDEVLYDLSQNRAVTLSKNGVLTPGPNFRPLQEQVS